MAELRFQLDEHVPHAVAEALRRDGIDVLTTTEAGLLGQPDSVQLAHAYATGRVIFTQDRDFLRLNRQDVAHSGIVYAAHGTRSIGQIVAGLRQLHRELSAETIVGQVKYL